MITQICASISEVADAKYCFVEKFEIDQIFEKVTAASMSRSPGRTCRGLTSGRMFTPPIARDQIQWLVKTVEAKPCLVEQYFNVGRGQ